MDLGLPTLAEREAESGLAMLPAGLFFWGWVWQRAWFACGCRRGCRETMNMNLQGTEGCVSEKGSL